MVARLRDMPDSFFMALFRAFCAFLVAVAAPVRAASISGANAAKVESKPCVAVSRIVPIRAGRCPLVESHLGPTVAPIPPAACAAACQR